MTVEGCSKRSKTTKYRSGTASYRAPEILGQTPKFSQKVDLWAIGCILYELIAGEPLFDGDHEIIRFAADEKGLEMPIFPFAKATNFFLLDLIRKVLSVTPNDRGSAVELTDMLAKFRIRPTPGETKYDWVTGGDEELRHCRHLMFGAFGAVHEVTTMFRIYANLSGHEHVYMQGTFRKNRLISTAFCKKGATPDI
jgi:serine/threonine protein kinase